MSNITLWQRDKDGRLATDEPSIFVSLPYLTLHSRRDRAFDEVALKDEEQDQDGYRVE